MCARFIQNFWQTTSTKAMVEKRVNTISNTCNYDKARVAKWAYIDYIMSNCWTLEENRIPIIDSNYLNALESIFR